MNLRAPLLLALGLVAIGCGPKKLDSKPPPDMDFNSGPDGKRTGAMRIEVNKLTAPDEVNYDKGDQTDWKMVELRGKPGLLTVVLHWDNGNSDMNVDLYDGMGTNIASSPGPQPGAQEKQLLAQIDQPAVYFIRVIAPKTHDGSIYTLEVKWDEPPPPPPKVAEETPVEEPAEKKPKKVHHVEHHEHASHAAKFDPDSGVQGHIVGKAQEGDGLKLFIDKGSAAGVKVGQNGTVLDGPSGATALDGGSFSVIEVKGDNRCVARTSLHSLGKNNRASINVK